MISPISPVVDLSDRLFQRLVVAAHQAAGDLEVLPLGLFARPEHAANARRIDGERLLHEDVAALLRRRIRDGGPEAGGVARMTTPPGPSESIAFL